MFIFVDAGHTLKELIEPLSTTDPTTTTINTNNNLCTVNVTYEDGGGLLSAAVGLSFTLSAAMVIANYCGLFLCHTNIDGKSHLAFWFCAQHNHHDNDDDEETKNDATEEVAVGKEESNKSESGEYAKGLERRNEYS